jgi:hypothetical protein
VNIGSSTNLCAGNYTVTATDANGCNISNPFSISASSPVNAVASSTVASCSTCNDGSASVNALGGVGPYTYTWSPAGGNGPNAFGLAPGCYTVTVSDQVNCIGTATTCVSFATGIATNGPVSIFSIYPNPTNGLIVIESGVMIDRTVEVVDVTGRLILSETHASATFTIDLSAYSNGVYYLKVKEANGSKQFKVVKQ